MEDCFCEGEAAVKKRGTQYSCELLHAGKRSGKKHGMIDLKQFELLHWHGLFCIGLARHDMAVRQEFPGNAYGAFPCNFSLVTYSR